MTFWLPALALFVLLGLAAVLHSFIGRKVLRESEQRRQTLLLPGEACSDEQQTFMISFTVIDLPTRGSAPYDFYIRLNGTHADSALIVFRDFENLVSESNEVNLVVALHDYIGNLKSADFAIDNADYDSGQMIGQLTQLEIRDGIDFAWGDYAVTTQSGPWFLYNREKPLNLELISLIFEMTFFNFYLPTVLFAKLNKWNPIDVRNMFSAKIEEVFTAFMIITMFIFLRDSTWWSAFHNSGETTLNLNSGEGRWPFMWTIISITTVITTLVGIMLRKLHSKPDSCKIEPEMVSMPHEKWIEMDWRKQSLFLRSLLTLKEHTGTRTKVSKQLALEKIVTNYPPDEFNKETAASIRSRMTNLPQETQLKTSDSKTPTFYVTKMTTTKPSYVGTLHRMSKELLQPTGTRFIRREVYRLENKIVDKIILSECYSRDRANFQKVRKSFEDADCSDSILYENTSSKQKPTTRRGIPLPPTPPTPAESPELPEGVPRHVARELSDDFLEQEASQPAASITDYEQNDESDFSIFKKPRRKVKDKDNPFPWLRAGANEAIIKEENKVKRQNARGKSPARRLFLGENGAPRPSSGKIRRNEVQMFEDEFIPLSDTSDVEVSTDEEIMNKNRPMVDIGIDYDEYLRKKDDDMDTFLDEQEFFDIAEEIKMANKSSLAPSAGIFGKSFHPDADDILNPLIEASRQRAQLDNSCAILAASITYIGMTSLLILYMIYGLRTFWADENYSGFLLVSWFLQFLFSMFISSYFIAKIEFDRYIRSLEDIYEDLQYDRSMDYYPTKKKDEEPEEEAEPASDQERVPSPVQIDKDDKSTILGEYVDYESELKKNMSSMEIIAKLEKYADKIV